MLESCHCAFGRGASVCLHQKSKVVTQNDLILDLLLGVQFKSRDSSSLGYSGATDLRWGLFVHKKKNLSYTSL